jgi:outer membrane protein TolC
METQLEDARRSVSIAQKNYDLARSAFQRGLTDYLNVLIAQTQLLRAQEGVAKVQAERLNANASLATALGGGLMTLSDGPTERDIQPTHARRSEPSSATSNAKSVQSN